MSRDTGGRSSSQRTRLVQTAAAKLRDIILAREPGAQIGSLNEVGALLGVGIVTVQQAARILEHEGLLSVRRGPGGGYYGERPDEAALTRALATYVRVHGSDFHEAVQIITLLDSELVPAAARSGADWLRKELQALSEGIAKCDTTEARIAFEKDLRRVLSGLDGRPLQEMIRRVAGQLYDPVIAGPPLYPGERGAAAWKDEKRRIIDAILKQDPDLARFEYERYRRNLLARLRNSRPRRRGRSESVDS